MYKLPALPGTSPGQSRGYSVTDQPLSAPANSTAHTPNFGSAGIAATVGAEFVYIGSPAGPQYTPQLTALYGTPTVYVYRVRLLIVQLAENAALCVYQSICSGCIQLLMQLS